jgi:hypothetical protein
MFVGNRMLCILSLLLGTLSHSHAQVTLKGRVVDIGQPEGKEGVDNVTVQVFNSSPYGLLTEGITGVDGRYELTVQSSGKGKLLLQISKVGYLARPLIQEARLNVQEQKTARLAVESGSTAYYEQIERNMLVADATTLTSFFPTVLALSGSEKQSMLDRLKLRSEALYAEYEQSNSTLKTSQAMKTALNPESAILVYPNFEVTGTILLLGAVPTSSEKDAIRHLTASISSLAVVENRLEVERGAKTAGIPNFEGNSGLGTGGRLILNLPITGSNSKSQKTPSNSQQDLLQRRLSGPQ